MKLKRLPEDFQVEELPLVAAGERGRFTFYRLTKRGLGTLEAIEAISRRWNLPRSRISYGGMKDRHALTVQYLTIADGPFRPLHQTNLDLEPLGRLPHPYGPKHFQGNRFAVVLRDMGAEAASAAAHALEELPRDGLPNYFDTQRFGSVSSSGGFVAEAWLAGDSERALRLAIAEPNPSDRPETKAEKAIVRDFWGNWPEAKAQLGRSHARSLVTYLVDHPTDFRGAFARVRRDLRSLYFSAYQSHIWNLMLASLIEQTTRPEQRVWLDFKVAKMPIHHGLDSAQAEKLASWRIPLPSSRNKLLEGSERELALGVMSQLGLAWEQLRVKHLKDVFFSKGLRPALFFPGTLKHALTTDDLYPGRQKLVLSFDLPKGAYATLVVKRVTMRAPEPSGGAGDDEEELIDPE
jgi:tRNA pseudouridine13 synthase